MITIYHNAKCSKSRDAMQLLRDRQLEAQVVEYLKQPPDAETITRLIEASDRPAADFVRTGDDAFKELDVDLGSLTTAGIARLLAAHPACLQRPIVDCDGKVALGRPLEDIEAILP